MISYVAGTVLVATSSKASGRHYQEVAGVIAQHTPYAYHPVPPGTVLSQQVPAGAFVITEQGRHSSVTCSLLPADAATAEACIAYLVEHAESQDSLDRLIERFASTQGRWYRLTAGERPQTKEHLCDVLLRKSEVNA